MLEDTAKTLNVYVARKKKRPGIRDPAAVGMRHPARPYRPKIRLLVEF
jgi:hypothetical protein